MRAAPALLALLLAAGVAPAQESLPSRQDYAWGFELVTGDGPEYFAAPLPAEVYRSVTDPLLRDLGVFNADDLPVPRMVLPPPTVEARESRVALGLVPLQGAPEQQSEQLRLIMRQADRDITLELDPAQIPGQGALAAYIIDARDRDPPLLGLQLDWGEQDGGFIGQVTVEDSEDLGRWRHLGNATIADLTHAETRIRQARVDFARPPADFLRLTWQNLPDDWRLDGATGIQHAAGEAPDRDWLMLAGSREDASERAYRYDAGGFPPVDRVRVRLEGANVVLRGRLQHRASPDDAWGSAGRGLFYRLTRDGVTLESPPLELAGLRSREWRLLVDTGVVTAAPRLELGWRPDRLLFVAQGPGPYQLAAGRAGDATDDFPQQRLLGDAGVFEMLRAAADPGSAQVGARFEVGGQGQLERQREFSWRVALLWAGLVAAVGVVLWLAVSIQRDLGQG